MAKKKKTEQKHELLYIMSPSCGWCKKVMPDVDSIVENGTEILKLDVADGDNRKLQDGSGDAGSQTGIFVDMSNNQDIGGFQFVIDDAPDLLSYINVLPTDRTEGFTVSAAEGEQGVTVIGFSLTGATIAPGTGSIVDIDMPRILRKYPLNEVINHPLSVLSV